MKFFIKAMALSLIAGMGVSQAQLVTESWSLGLGLSYPRMYSINTPSLNSDFGAYLSIQRNFSEHVGVRLKPGYSFMQGEYTDSSATQITQTTHLITADLDLLYYLVPCEPLSPYLFAGVGGNYKSITNPQTTLPDNNTIGSQLNIGVGVEYKVNSNWNVAAEFGYHVTNNSELEGTIVPAELNGRDSYLVLSAGISYFFGKGQPSKKCEECPCSPQSKELTDYARIEELIVKHIPKVITKEVVSDKYILAFKDDRLVLVGVKFAFDKTELLPESYDLLDKSVGLLNAKPDAKFEVQGYTDYIGTDAYNMELSIERAQLVKAYLVSKGIAQNRLTVVGFGKNDPIEDNATAEGRAQNRRIVFKIIK